MIGNIGLPELLLILLLVLLLFGSKRLPEIGRSIGLTLKELKRTASRVLDDEEQSRKNGRTGIESKKRNQIMS
ncbi:twin-arginine translocase TatA/TatE family subunit [Polycladomyces subterraneus]|uniref:Sec-independent protein translocase protein TatA n=1 Tax=Polycladomyces subterraneus TaxID=1016997 RepID=A0ABT8IKM8_9BACL|nr:twin-arginine translocase TatA/TatE family subunit [Polycladomyces subterraneus]MDN4593332.1 twin-arginine translocase TatA/TatE family subunit [Polycladomyces subterraneus]